MFPHHFPIIPGWDVAGEVVALGEGANSVSVGDSIYAYARLPSVQSGTYSEYIALPESYVALKPKNVSAPHAAAIPLVALTAYQGLYEVAKIQSAERVLILGGSGGVGSFAIQFAKLAGAHVTATASSANRSYLEQLGVDTVIDYKKDSVNAADYDLIFDTVGGESLKNALASRSAGTRFVSIVETPPQGLFHFVYPNGSQLQTMATLFEAGKLKLPEVKIRRVLEAADAQDESQRGHTRGKVVLAIDFKI
jgi:NADPH:quinone reductase-like Zn-dependent oxidoreductase